MGATTDYRSIKDADRKTIKEKFAEACEEARYDHGHGGYTGTIAEMHGIKEFADLNCDSRNAAEDHISDHHEKWDDAMAVSYRNSKGEKFWLVGGWCSE